MSKIKVAKGAMRVFGRKLIRGTKIAGGGAIVGAGGGYTLGKARRQKREKEIFDLGYVMGKTGF